MASSDANRLVRPRVVPLEPGSAGTWLLEDVIAERLARGETGELWICGAVGSGLRTARAVLERLFSGDARIRIDREEQIVDRARSDPHPREDLAVRFCRAKGRVEHVLELAPWARDEWIEYLLARHPEHCTSVMRRLDALAPPLDGAAAARVWAAVLDELAADPQLPDAFEALRAALARAFAPAKRLARARTLALASLESGTVRDLSDSEVRTLLDDADWLRQEPALLMLVAEALVMLLEKESGGCLPQTRVDLALLDVIRPLLLRSPSAREELVRVLSMDSRGAHPWAASLLHLFGASELSRRWPGKGDPGEQLPLLSGARLRGVDLARRDLVRIEMLGADLEDARFQDSNLTGALLRAAQLARASLRAAILAGSDLRGANLFGADLAGADAREVRLDGAVLDRADLTAAQLQGGSLEGCALCGTRLEGANLEGARLVALDLRPVRGLAARFAGAGLARANLEGLACVAPDFSRADLEGALLSGTRFPRANFQGAILRNTGLAWVDWEGANLFDADLTGASFHLGSSRSGLVFHAPAGWGTRTGFYTDEAKDQSFKTPEEIRTANLRGADLRKALLFQTDFYLVDVREALYTPDQELHLRGCGAIL